MGYITVIGAGSWGTTLAAMLADKGYDTTLWALETEVADSINQTGINSLYLPDVELPKTLHATSDLEKALSKARFVLNVVPTQHTRKVFEQAGHYIPMGAHIISAAKGIENGTYMTVCSIIKEVCGRPAAALSGPSFADEVTRKLPTAVTLAAEDQSVALLLQEIFSTDYFRVYTHDDVKGVELGGALKNVMAVASGISEGLGLGNSARSALITRALAEMTRLGVSLGAREATFSGLSGLGDLVLTCSSHLSRNFTVGFRLGKGESFSQIMEGRRTVAEGVFTAKAAYELSKRQAIEMPIVEQVYGVLYEGKSAREVVANLMTRAPKAEFHGLGGPDGQSGLG